MGTNFQDCVYNYILILTCWCKSVWYKKIALGDQCEFILANCYFNIKQIPSTVFENVNPFKIYLVISYAKHA